MTLLAFVLAALILLGMIAAGVAIALWTGTDPAY
jgi:hypothetical protein